MVTLLWWSIAFALQWYGRLCFCALCVCENVSATSQTEINRVLMSEWVGDKHTTPQQASVSGIWEKKKDGSLLIHCCWLKHCCLSGDELKAVGAGPYWTNLHRSAEDLNCTLISSWSMCLVYIYQLHCLWTHRGSHIDVGVWFVKHLALKLDWDLYWWCIIPSFKLFWWENIIFFSIEVYFVHVRISQMTQAASCRLGAY